MSEIKDSGTRREFETGSVRDISEGKGRMDLLPAAALMRLSQHFEAGCKKYGDRNWERGQPLHCYIDSGLRHIAKVLDGQEDEPHLVAGIWNLICFLETAIRIKRGELPQELNDLPKFNLDTML